ncbi:MULTISPECIES: type III PLP-dependent enzyme [Pseudoalteromonas]|jgi:ornithine decarboxylase|uniref:Ornithine decarboxylase n=1 Tax=Pseudoalteromonas carrageenovora IAM 12662 TaxID=1314868 RepID=A0A2K4XFG2_PSEVC|nr:MULTISPECIES: type III PLP-dependent enzyme [Pseudoalteromonas]KTF09176.1 ornithine decarboxylase [Pseudoalteromonas sp. H103]MBE0384667.1 ornithine decarboxylase [Pseudoalteromonas carrageenovora IAM 12662]MDO6465311.1 type III PLP-dependent enzyme [Pseudoalteromonas carrageenovora]MDO6635103.1 type III PLP-dependent enzyme [Pseudoalteromonas carrageenovora]MDO6647581.1 type III PLP-dependent enzyme [Pseudoalteromonas carrageenovora]
MTLSTQLKDTVTKVPAAAVAANQAFDYVQPTNTHIEQLAAQFGAPLMVLDCEAIRRQYHALKNALPGVVLHFALKPLPLAAVVRTLLEEGASFDLATSGEVDLVASQGVPSERTIHTHPIKRDSDIRDALAYGCTVFVVDNINELEKFIAYKDQAEILVRLSFRNKDAFADLSKKFGCSPDVAIDIISYAQQLGIRIKGLSFHVGSQSPNPTKYVEAINACAKVITKVSELGLPALSTLDIGGGFPVPYSVDVLPIDVFCAPINVALAQLPETMQIIAEPGRFIVASSVTSVASVMGQAQREGKTWYYLDDGIYGSFSGLMFDEAAYPIDSAKQEGERFESVLAGPTCDSIDVVSDSIMLPKLNNGDLIISRMMGAYTLATATDFNFFKRAEVVVLNEQVHSQVLTG